MSNTHDFLARVLPAEGKYFVAKVDEQHKFHQTSVPTLESVEHRIKALTGKAQDVYVAIGSFSLSRTVKCVTAKKSFYVDIDCGEGKPYGTHKEALAAMVKATKAGIPSPSYIVNSGGGIHLYWVLEKSLTYNRWKVIADGLSEAVKHVNLLVDPGITADGARIMRMPGSINYKDRANPRACSILYASDKDYDEETFQNAIYALAPTGKVLSIAEFNHAKGKPEKVKSADNSDLGEAPDYKTKPKAVNMVTQCEVFRNAIETGGKEHPGELWIKLLWLLSYCDDGRRFAHGISKRHPEYALEETDDRWTRAIAQQADGTDKHPTGCRSIAGHGCATALCNVCPHNGAIKSPLSLAHRDPSGCPSGYENRADGTYKRDGDGDFQILSKYKLEDVTLSSDPVNGMTLQGIFKVGTSTYTRVFAVPTKYMYDNQPFAGACNECEILTNDFERKELRAFMLSWAKQLQASGNSRKKLAQLGWTKDGQEHGFLSGPTIYWEDGREEPHSMTDPALRSDYTPEGTLEPWKKAAALTLADGREEMAVTVASAFASPLMSLTGVAGALITLVGDKSGTGKSTALRVAQAVWCNPKRGVHALNDTPNAVAKKLGIVNNLPAYWDELRMKDQIDKFIQLVFQLGQGKEKARLDRNSSMADMGTWTTLIVAASNESIVGHMEASVTGTDAGLRRILELPVRPLTMGAVGMGESNATFSELDKNYGWAGAIYAKWLAMHRAKADELVRQVTTKIQKLSGANPEDRFWVAAGAATVAGAVIAKSLKLVAFDVNGLLKYVVARIKAAKDEVKDADYGGAEAFIQNFAEFADMHRSNIIHTKKRPHSGKAGELMGILNHGELRGEYYGRYAEDSHTFLVTASIFNRWYRKNASRDIRTMRKTLESCNLLVYRSAVLTAGTAISDSRRSRVYEVDMTLANK